MHQKKIMVPTEGTESWKSLLADPEKHWQPGYSAMSVANSWEICNGIPDCINKSLSRNPEFLNLELLIAVPEFKVPLPGGSRPSQNDLFFLASNEKGLLSCTVEAKVREDFDKTIFEWKKDESTGKITRLDFLLNKLCFPSVDPSPLRYQLFHRLASAVIMAEKFHAQNAVMVIQSFVESDKENHFNDFKDFVECYGKTAVKHEPILLTVSGGINIYALWVFSGG